ncbi:ComF family protein [Spirochaetales bacterium BR208]|uniref:ComF family protein n=2 Tax=Entomospira nematocerorum TaxID=2719987 RepID=A0A968GBV7_9SPIO|nr:ComF family protein [Entomospira nematocera]
MNIGNIASVAYCVHCSIPFNREKGIQWCDSCIQMEYHRIPFSYQHESLSLLVGKVKSSLYVAKFSHIYSYKRYWGRLLYNYMIHLKEKEYVYVLAPSKKREHLMDAIKKELGSYGIVNVYTFLRKKKNIQQKNLDWMERRRAQDGNIYIPKRSMKIVYGKRWIILDDIYTTGSTLYHSAKVLYEHGALDVRSISLSMSIPPLMKSDFLEIMF